MPLDNASLLAPTERPDHLIVVGGSYIGLELGQIFPASGGQVTILHRADRLTEREDADVSVIIADIMRAEDIDLRLNASVGSVGGSMRGVLVTLEDETELSGSHILFATGRVPNTDALESRLGGSCRRQAGLYRDGRTAQNRRSGHLGLGRHQPARAFTHTAYHDHEIVLAHRDGLTDLHQWRGADARVTTYAMFTDPPLGRVGLTRAEAQALVAKGKRILISDMPMERVSRAKEEGETTGLIRLIVDAESERFLGATVFGLAGDEIIATLTNYMATSASYRIMQQALPVHPTVAEFLPTILAGLKPLEAADG